MVTLKNGLGVKVFKSGAGYVSNPPSRYGWDIYPFVKVQSNGIGRASIRPGIDDDYSAVSGRVFQYGYNAQQVMPATNPLDHVNENPGQMGLWLEFVKLLVPLLTGQRKILLVPCGQGGTSFAGGFWNPGNSLDNNAKARVASALALPGGTNRICAVLTILGESDADAGSAAASLFQSRYQTAYNDYVANVPGFSASIPWIMGTINPAKPNAATINNALFNLAATNGAMQCIDCRDLSFLDNDHYDAPSLATIGQRFAAAYLGV